MTFVKGLVARAKLQPQRIVLPEGTELRTIKAADRVLGEGVAHITLLGNKDDIKALSKELQLANIGNCPVWPV